MKKIKNIIAPIVIFATILWVSYMVVLMIKSCQNYNPTPVVDNQVKLTKEQAYQLFEDAYNAGYRKGRHYARISKLTPFEIDVESDSAMVMDKYFK
jgi:hypothetical protein